MRFVLSEAQKHPRTTVELNVCGQLIIKMLVLALPKHRDLSSLATCLVKKEQFPEAGEMREASQY